MSNSNVIKTCIYTFCQPKKNDNNKDIAPDKSKNVYSAI